MAPPSYYPEVHLLVGGSCVTRRVSGRGDEEKQPATRQSSLAYRTWPTYRFIHEADSTLSAATLGTVKLVCLGTATRIDCHDQEKVDTTS